MKRCILEGAEFNALTKQFRWSAEEIAESNATGAERDERYNDHQRVVGDLVKIAEQRGWQTRDNLGYPDKTDMWVDYDVFRSRVVHIELIYSLRDEAECAILEIMAKPENQKYCVVVNFDSQPSPNFV